MHMTSDRNSVTNEKELESEIQTPRTFPPLSFSGHLASMLDCGFWKVTVVVGCPVQTRALLLRVYQCLKVLAFFFAYLISDVSKLQTKVYVGRLACSSYWQSVFFLLAYREAYTVIL